MPRIEDVGSTSWKQLRSSRGMLEMMMMMMIFSGCTPDYAVGSPFGALLVG